MLHRHSIFRLGLFRLGLVSRYVAEDLKTARCRWLDGMTIDDDPYIKKLRQEVRHRPRRRDMPPWDYRGCARRASYVLLAF
jgi:hypothetical protein